MMIDWVNLGFNSLWILGLSLVLAVTSMMYYHSRSHGKSFREVWNTPRYQRGLNIGLTLFSLGLLGTAQPLPEKIIWGFFMLWFAYQIWEAKNT
jgi:hypothetical protein